MSTHPELLAEPPAAPGMTVGRYIVIEEVGRGAMGRVLRAYDPRLQREVALKVVRAGLLGSRTSERLVVEARAMAQLNAPNVVGIYDVEELPFDDVVGMRVVLAMEYVAGSTLRNWLTEERTWREALSKFVAAGRGLAAAHQAGVLHRDFKPSNVMVAPGGVVKVTDFGLAKLGATRDGSRDSPSRSVDGGERLTRSGIAMGTPRYMAPEQHAGAEVTEATDQYNFCVALWEAMTGKPPFEGEQLQADKRRGPPPWPADSDVPAIVVDAVRRGLSPKPSDRWPSMEALLQAISVELVDEGPPVYTDADVRAAQRLRLAVVLGTLVGGLILVLDVLRRMGMHQPGYLDAAAVISVYGVVIAWAGRRLRRLGATANIRRANAGALVSCAALVLSFVVGGAMGVPFRAGLALATVLAGSAAAWMAVTLDRRFGPAAVVFAVTAAALAVSDTYYGLVLAFGSFSAFAVTAIVFRLRGPLPEPADDT